MTARTTMALLTLAPWAVKTRNITKNFANVKEPEIKL
jgi:hypothetical protein